MHISSLSVRGVAGVEDLHVDWMASTGRPHDVVVITGPEASGKTRLLELVLAGLEVIGPYEGIVRGADWVGAGGHATLELGIWLDDTERDDVKLSNPVHATVTFGPSSVTTDAPRSLSRLVSRYDHDPAHGKREYFFDGRQPPWGARRDGTGELEQSLWRAGRDPHKYSFLPRFLSELVWAPDRRAAFADAIERLSNRITYVPSLDTPGACFSVGGAPPVEIDELSRGEADAVILAATVALTGFHHSIGFLDRPERHVSPDRSAAWLRGLRSLGANNQWLIASSDPGFVGLAGQAVVTLGPRDGSPARGAAS